MVITGLMLLALATEIISRLTIGSLTWRALTIRTVRSEECRDSFDELIKYLRVEITNNRRPISEPNQPGDVALVLGEYGIFQSSDDGVCTFTLHPLEPGTIIRGSNRFDSRPMKLRFQGRKFLGSVSILAPWGLLSR
jgi:hypothetical protein